MTRNKTVNPMNGKTLEELFKSTQGKIEYLKDRGYDVKQMWECEWERRKKEDNHLKDFVKTLKRPCDAYYTMTEDQILQAVMNDQLFGALEVDVHVPNDLKTKFAEMPPIFKNIEISRDDIGDHMKTYAVP